MTTHGDGMCLLVVGGGGREHTLVRRLVASPRVRRVLVAPGNGGTAAMGPQVENVPVKADDIAALVTLASAEQVDLVVVGPEAPLVAGLADAMNVAGVRCFGPSAAAARLEGSKAFSKAFMNRVGIPAARSTTFTDADEAAEWVQQVPWPVVVKASGLAAGKGVVVCDDDEQALTAIDAIMVQRIFGAAGDELLIEERLTGQEVSVLAFCDGEHIAVLPPAQDHKPVFAGDRGPNTGGMGAYAPTPVLDDAGLAAVAQDVMQATLDGMNDDGTPYVGVLYAGLMLTADGPRVLEYNVRFGDPETQVLLPLLRTDLVEVMIACVEGRLNAVDMQWHDGAAATVVAASAGYPGPCEKGLSIDGLARADALEGVEVVHAGTRLDEAGVLRTSGGRVLSVTGRGADLVQALERAYAGMDVIRFDGMHHREDIGGRVLGARHPRAATVEGGAAWPA